MKKRMKSIPVMISMMLMVFSGMTALPGRFSGLITANAAVAFSGGTGTSASPYIITTAAQLNEVRNDLTAHYKLGANIDLSSYHEWVPIGNGSIQFTGTFDGGGYTISNLTINNSSFYTGFFGYVGKGGTIKNVGLTSVNVTGAGYVGGLVGESFGTLTNAYVSGSVKSTGSNVPAGGLAGMNYGTITNAFVVGSVRGGSTSNVGGLVGDNESSISTVYFTGSVSVGSGDKAGVVGYNHGSVSDSYTNVSPLSAYNVKGYSSVSGSSVESLTNMELQSTYGSTWSFTTTKATVGTSSSFPSNLNSVTISGTTGAAITSGNKITYNYLENTIGIITLSDSSGHSQNVPVSVGQSTVTVTTGAFQGLTLHYTDHNDNKIYQNTIIVTGPWGIRAGKTTPYFLGFKPSPPSLTVNPLVSTKFSAVQNTLSVTGSVDDGSVGEPVTMKYDIWNNSNVSVTSPTSTVYATGGALSIDDPISLAGLAAGSYTLHVSAKDTYNAAVNATPQSFTIDPTLSGLSLNHGTLSSPFATGTTSYTDSVANSVSSITVTPTVADPGDTVTVDGTTVASGTASASIPLTAGSNSITVVVTAKDGTTTNTYTIDVNRAKSSNANLRGLILSSGSLSPTFASGTTNYTASVTNSVSSVTVTPTLSDNTAAVKVDGKAVTSGSPSGPIALNVGSNPVSIVVTAQDGVTQKTYTLKVSRATPLALSTSSSLPNVLEGTSYSQELKGIGGMTPYTFSIATGSLPNGLTLQPDGSLGGTPQQGGIFHFTVQITDDLGTTTTKDMSLYVIPTAPTGYLKTTSTKQVVDNSGGTLTTKGTHTTATLVIASGTFTNPLQMDITTGTISNSLLPSGWNLVAAYGVNFDTNDSPTHKLSFTLLNAGITPQSKVYKIVNGKLVSVTATVTQGKAIVTFTTDPDFVVLQPKPVPQATTPVTGFPAFPWEAGALLSILTGGLALWWHRRRKTLE